MARAIWKGAISFGLVNVPVALHAASQSDDIDFDWLDKRSMDPVGYQRINKRTGKPIPKDDIVKGVKTSSGEYVVLSEEEIAEAYPKTVQSIEIQAFVQAADVSFVYFERPYFLEPSGRGGDKTYALLREAMVKAGVVGIARLVMHTKEHLAAVIPAGPALMLDLLRWSDEVRSGEGLDLPGKDVVGRIKPAELQMAGQLVEQMTAKWKPGDYADTFRDAIEALVDRKAKAGKTFEVEALEPVPEGANAGGNVVDLTALLRSSLGRGAAKGESVPAKRTRAAAPAKEREAHAAAKEGRAARKPVVKRASTASKKGKAATRRAARQRA